MMLSYQREIQHCMSLPMEPIVQTTSNDTGQVRYTNGKKRQKLRHVVTNDDNRLSIGMEWSNATLSCAYDCLFTILRNVYINNPLMWIENIKKTNRFITMLTNGWETDGHVHEVTCDKIHRSLHTIDPETFTIGNGTDLFALCERSCNVNHLCSGTIISVLNVINSLNQKNKCIHGGMSLPVNILRFQDY